MTAGVLMGTDKSAIPLAGWAAAGISRQLKTQSNSTLANQGKMPHFIEVLFHEKASLHAS